MAKKVVGKVKGKASKGMTKLVVPLRSPKTGAYTFKEVMVHQDDIASALKALRE